MGQAIALGEMLRDHCSLYNGVLQERRDAYRHPSLTGIRYGQQSGQLKDIRAFDPERQGRRSFSSQQATWRRLDKAFAAFFRRVKAGETPGYPRFRGVNWFGTVDFLGAGHPEVLDGPLGRGLRGRRGAEPGDLTPPARGSDPSGRTGLRCGRSGRCDAPSCAICLFALR